MRTTIIKEKLEVSLAYNFFTGLYSNDSICVLFLSLLEHVDQDNWGGSYNFFSYYIHFYRWA